MTIEGVFTFLFPIVPLVATAGFFPQIIKLVKAQDSLQNHSLGTWAMWVVCSAIALSYSALVLKDFAMIMNYTLLFTCQASIFSIIIYKRKKYPPHSILSENLFADLQTYRPDHGLNASPAI